MDYVARLQVLQGQTTWRAHDVPDLTAGALCPVAETRPLPVVDLLRIDTVEGREVLRPLTESDRAALDSHWQLCGLSRAREQMTSNEWVPYLVAFNEPPHRPAGADWHFAVMPPHDPNHVARLAHEVTRQNHEARLKAAIERGEVVARLSDMTEPPAFMSLSHLVLTRSELVKFCVLLCIEVVDIPHFITSARPLEVPAALLALPDDARVSYEHNIARQRGSGITNAADYRESIRDTMARQAEGHFTLNEAAQVLADSRPGLDPMETVKRFRLAHSKGELPIHQGGSRFPLEVGETVRDFWDTVGASELDAWLRASVGYGFPAALSVPPSAAPASAIETPKQRRARLLEMHDAEVSAGRERGALARITEIEKRTRPTADRSNIGKEIRKAREERDAERKGGALTRLLR